MTSHFAARLLICATLVSCAESTDLLVTIENRQADATKSCLGENVTYICTLSDLSHLWSIPELGVSVTIMTAQLSVPPFSIRLVSSDSTSIISSLSVTAYAALNNTAITCSNSTGETQQITAEVLGTPSAPTLTAAASGADFDTLAITIIPPAYAAVCALLYTISTTSSTGSIIPDFNVTVQGERGVPVQVSRGGFDLCNATYNLSVVAFTSVGYGARSDPFAQDITDFLDPVLNITTDLLTINLSWIEPTTASAYDISIKRSTREDDSCSHDLSDLINGTQSSILVPLNCSYAGKRVTFCLQFINSNCQSRVASLSTHELPNLVTAKHIVTSGLSSINVIIIKVTVNEQLRCDDHDTDQFEIRVTLMSSSRNISSETVLFADGGIVVFDSVPRGEYNCTASVLVDSTIIVSNVISCSLSSTGSHSDNNTTIALSVLFVYLLSVVVAFSLGVVAMRYWYNNRGPRRRRAKRSTRRRPNFNSKQDQNDNLSNFTHEGSINNFRDH